MPSKRYFYDTEFLDNGRTIDLISIGIVAEDGRGYYAVNTEANIDAAKTNPWIVANVLPHLPMNNRGCLDRVAADGRHPTRTELEQVDLDRTRARWQYLHVVEHAQRAKLAAYPAGLPRRPDRCRPRRRRPHRGGRQRRAERRPHRIPPMGGTQRRPGIPRRPPTGDDHR